MKRETRRQHPPFSVAINTGIHHGFCGGFLGSIRAVIRAIIKAIKDLFFNVLNSDILAALVELLPLFQLFHN
ncbi:hypothetical protein PG989_010910 [Apiospora arundinis]